MNLIELVKKSFNQIVNTPSVTLFLVLFLIFSNVLAAYSVTSKTKIIAMILIMCTFSLTICFFAGWLGLIAVLSKSKEKEEKNYFAIFLEEIGKNIVPITIGSFIYTFLLIIVLFITSKIAFILFGSVDSIIKDFMNTPQDNNAMIIEYFKNLSDEQKYTIYAWNLSFFIAMILYNFLMLFYAPAIIFNEKSNIILRPFVAIKDAFCFLFKNFLGAFGLYFIVNFIYIILAVSKTYFASNTIIAVLLLFVYIYFMCVTIMLIFNYYEEKSNSSNGCDCIGEDKTINQPCKED